MSPTSLHPDPRQDRTVLGVFTSNRAGTIRLCRAHLTERQDLGETITVPLMDQEALAYILTDRPVPVELQQCTDCRTENHT